MFSNKWSNFCKRSWNKIGAVKIDVDRDNIQWYPTNLSDPLSVKGLVKFRTTYDLLYNRQSNFSLESFNDLAELPDEVICLYTWLDECIEKCGLTDKQLNILNKYMDDNTEEEIATDLNVTQQTVNGIINSCCKKISNYNNQKWKNEFILWSKQKVKTNYKQCSKCKESLPTTEEFFSLNTYSKDNLHSICKNCRNLGNKPCWEGILNN